MSHPYEHLLAVDPIGAINKIKDDYLRYFRNMYRFRDKDLDNRKNKEIEINNNLYQKPYCELLPKYQSTNLPLDELIADLRGQRANNSPDFPMAFDEFIRRGLISRALYKHQAEMLRKGYLEDKNVLITSGTGSGKTESFLLPLLASLLKEAEGWSRIEKADYNPEWFASVNNRGQYVPNQRLNENRQNRPAAIRSLLLYPMNALVADQIARLRKALDSDDVRAFMRDNSYNGHRIFFGSYNGNTVQSGQAHEYLNNLLEQSRRIQQAANNGECEPDDIYAFPRISRDSFTSEMIVRDDMWQYPPDIFITNVSMLSIMLMRKEEQEMLDTTRNYYIKNPDAKFHLIVDELHLHRGTAGAEVAYLLRMFLDRIGVPPMVDGRPNKQLRIYASSASLGEGAQEFLKDFFGVYNPQNSDADVFEIQQGYPIVPEVKPNLRKLDYNDFKIFCAENNNTQRHYYEIVQMLKEARDANDNERIDVLEEQKRSIERQFLDARDFGGNIEDFVEQYAGKIYQDLLNLRPTLPNDEAETYATFPLDSMRELPGNPDMIAIRGFLIFRATTNHPMMPSIRFHQFFKYIEGLWGELLPPNTNAGQVIGELSFTPDEISSDGSHKMLELLRCECCGELFIGGNGKLSDARPVISLNSQQIDRVPNMQATPMVQRKKVDEYIVFWPNANGESVTPDPRIQDEKFYGHNGTLERFGVVDINGGKTARYSGNDNCHGSWRLAYLNPFDASISYEGNENSIRGFIYYPKNDRNQLLSNLIQGNQTRGALRALPCKCPKCGKDYLKRLYTQSPIRSFRTGIGRNNQILSKGLLYQLSPYKNHQPKLIGFSDSRQDAAEQSKLIAREHYRDMLRLAFILEIQRLAKGAENPDELNDLKADIAHWITINRPLDRIRSLIIGSGLGQTVIDALVRIIYLDVTDQEKIDQINKYIPPASNIVDLNNFIRVTTRGIDGHIVKKLLSQGINPAGTDHADMYPDNADSTRYWDRFYDFNLGEMRNPGIQDVDEKLTQHIFENCFGQYMDVNTEVSGLGYITSADIDGVPEIDELRRVLGDYLRENGLEIQGFIDAFIRIFGDCYRYPSNNFEQESVINYDEKVPNGIKKVIQHVANQIGRDEAELGSTVFNAMKAVAVDHENGLLDINKLRFKLMHGDEHYYTCECGRVHLHRGMGYCTNTSCLKKLPNEPDRTADGNSLQTVENGLWKEKYISYDIKVEPHELHRLHCEELTGQTDDQSSRLLKFKDIVIDGSEPLANKIDMLCVTTTMEVGVDIGGLEAIYQGNMPPTRYNYQQRAGRGGRGQQAYSAVLTFCRGRSHDTYYYDKEPLEITGGKPAIPSISVNPKINNTFNDVVIKRVILKHVIMLASADRMIDWRPFNDKSSTCAQLSRKSNWPNVSRELQNWMATHEDDIKLIIDYYLKQYLHGDELLYQKNEIFKWIIKDSIPQMTEAVNNSTQQDNAQAITEAGLLPLYGLPTMVRNFYHTCKIEEIDHRRYESYNGIIDRPFDLGISEFAPGNIKTKDSAEYKCAGLTVPLDFVNSYDDETELRNNQSELDPLEHSFTLTIDDNGAILDIGQYDQQMIQNNVGRSYRLVIPKAYRTDKLIKNSGDRPTESDSRSNFASVDVWVDNSNNGDPCGSFIIDDGVARIKVWNEKDVWYINTNNNEFFRGQKAYKITQNQRPKEPRFFNATNVQDQTLIMDCAPNFMTEIRDNGWRASGIIEPIAIGARKVTDIMCLTVDPSGIPDCLCLNANSGNRSAIIAGFYSAATLIQRVFADKIDIDPSEIEISEVKIDENGCPSVYLNDKAVNGAGFISMLCSEDQRTGNLMIVDIMRDIVSDDPSSKFIRAIREQEHHEECMTSCPKCLNTFYNRGLQHVLDWRLGMDIIKLMTDRTYRMGYDDLNNTPYGDLLDMMNKLGYRVKNANPGLEFIPAENRRWGYFTSTKDQGVMRTEHLVHPLWKCSEVERQDGYKAQNTFRLQRIPKSQPVEYVAPQPDPNPVQQIIPVQQDLGGDGRGTMG